MMTTASFPPNAVSPPWAAVASGDWSAVRQRRYTQSRSESVADHSPLELAEWARDHLRSERDSLRERIAARRVGG